MGRKSIGKPLQYNVADQNPRKKREIWRYKLSIGDLVEMKSGGLAIITAVKGDDYKFFGTDAVVPRVKIMYCNDNTVGSCSAWRVEKVVNESR
tara:strand:+ start:1017 stop:1295 length:279 start_codon:yes stop_codon:yes gene_type:complete